MTSPTPQFFYSHTPMYRDYMSITQKREIILHHLETPERRDVLAASMVQPTITSLRHVLYRRLFALSHSPFGKPLKTKQPFEIRQYKAEVVRRLEDGIYQARNLLQNTLDGVIIARLMDAPCPDDIIDPAKTLKELQAGRQGGTFLMDHPTAYAARGFGPISLTTYGANTLTHRLVPEGEVFYIPLTDPPRKGRLPVEFWEDKEDKPAGRYHDWLTAKDVTRGRKFYTFEFTHKLCFEVDVEQIGHRRIHVPF